jgi:glutathione S-transferase
LEMRYPTPSLMPTEITAIARMRMVQMVTVNELMPNSLAVINIAHEPLSNAVNQRLATSWQFLDDALQDQEYFGGDRLNLGDIVAGTTIPLFHRLGESLADYPRLNAWRQRIENRPAWQEIEPDEPSFQRWQRWIQLQIKRKTRSK